MDSQPGPQLVLLKQTSSSEEKYTKNGIIQTALVVIKNTPFTLQVGLRNNILFNQILDFNNLTLDARLVYDTDGTEKEVDFVKVKPLEVKTLISERGETASVESKIKVLTSQHEDMFFRIKLIALDPRTGQQFRPSFHVLSQPIKVISKPEQLKKKAPPAKKRTLNDVLVETITRLEQQQQEQAKQLGKLLEISRSDQNNISNQASSLFQASKGDKADDFDSIFKRLLLAYTDLPAEDRPVKLRKIARGLSMEDTERLSELVDIFSVEGLGREIGSEFGGGGEDVCVCKNCHYKQEITKLDDFYKDFLTTIN